MNNESYFITRCKMKLGKKGDVVKVADGYGQNFLIKNKLAVLELIQAVKLLNMKKK